MTHALLVLRDAAALIMALGIPATLAWFAGFHMGAAAMQNAARETLDAFSKSVDDLREIGKGGVEL